MKLTQRKFAIFAIAFVAISYYIAYHVERDRREQLEKKLEQYEKAH